MQLVLVYLYWFQCNSLLKYVSQPKITKKSVKTSILVFKVIALGANQKPVYDFLLVINSNLDPTSHRYWDTATHWLKIAIIPTPLSFSTLAQCDSFRTNGKALWIQKLLCVPKHPDIFGCNLKTNCQILIIFGTNIPDWNCHQMTIQFPTHSMYASALPRESRSSAICVKINRKPDKNISNIIDRNLNND